MKDTAANSAGAGYLGGTVKGAATGLTVGGPWGALIGAAIGGTGGLIKGLVQHKKRADAVDLVDANEANRLQQLIQARKSIQAGTDPASVNAKNENARLNASTQNVIARNSGGNVSSTINGFLRAQSNAQGNVNQIEANSRQQVPFYLNAEGDITQRMARRKLELQLLKQSQKNAQNAQDAKENNVNANALIGSMDYKSIAGNLSKVFNRNSGDGTSSNAIGGNNILGDGGGQSASYGSNLDPSIDMPQGLGQFGGASGINDGKID